MQEDSEAAANFSMAFFPAQQEALLGHMIDDKNFFLQVSGYVQPAFFTDPWVQKIYSAKLAFIKSPGRISSPVFLLL